MSLYDSITSKSPIDRGWSGDEKYRARCEDGRTVLLRISPARQYEKRRLGYEYALRAAKLGIPMCIPLDFGVYSGGVYSIHSWIEGVDAKMAVGKMDREKQYSLGVRAGEYLALIHTIPAPEGTEGWESYFNRKIDRKLKMYEECPLKYENGQLFIDYIEAHRHLLSSRPVSYQHGDYHLGNMMIGNDGVLYVIDFDRCDFGDPWEEFNRIVWCAEVAPEFARGMTDGYFGGDVPREFFELLALYIATNTLSSLPWAIPYGDEQIEVMRRQADRVLEEYAMMTNPIPSWYKRR